MSKRSLLAAAACAVVFAAVSAGTAFAGEVTGNGKPTAAPSNANSICAFSGQNDHPSDPAPEGGRTQSYGQLVSQGAADPHAFNPGDACHGGSNERRDK